LTQEASGCMLVVRIASYPIIMYASMRGAAVATNVFRQGIHDTLQELGSRRFLVFSWTNSGTLPGYLIGEFLAMIHVNVPVRAGYSMQAAQMAGMEPLLWPHNE